MKIEAGKYYRTRGGRKVGPVRFADHRPHPFVYTYDDPVAGYARSVTDSGAWALDGDPAQFDLVAEWTDGPVRTVTRREIVPGVYGVLGVGVVRADAVRIGFAGHMGGGTYFWVTAEELDSLAMVASQLAEALRDAKA